MKNLVVRMWNEEDGLLSFEWVLLVTLLTFGIVSGVAAARDAITDELGDVAQAMIALDQSYSIDMPLSISVHVASDSGGSNSEFIDEATEYTDCFRDGVPGQGAETDS